MKRFEFRLHRDAIPMGTSAEGNPVFRAGKRRAWLMVPVRVPWRAVPALRSILRPGSGTTRDA